jgi:hypothetical protein
MHTQLRVAEAGDQHLLAASSASSAMWVTHMGPSWHSRWAEVQTLGMRLAAPN